MTPFDIDAGKLIQQVEADLPAATALAKVTEAQQRARLLIEVGDQMVDHFVTAARSGGASWSHVGEALGVSKQAAHERWVPSIFQRYTDRSRSAIVVAQERARTLRHDSIAPGHLLLALFESDGLAKQLLIDAGVTATTLHAALADFVQEGQTVPAATVPFTGSAKRALDQAGMAAIDLGQNYIGTEHLLLGLFGTRDDGTDAALVALGLTRADLRQKVAEQMPANG
jgi:hypothetical protein